MDERRFIVAGRFIDGTGAGVRRNIFLAVQGGIIRGIGPVAALPRTDHAKIEDFSYCTVVPALVDCSVFLGRSSSVDRQVQLAAEEAEPAKKVIMLKHHMGYCHVHGVLGVVENDDITDLLQRYTEDRAEGGLVEVRSYGGACRSKQAFTAGGDFLKICYSGNIEDADEAFPPFSHEDLSDILRHKGGKKVVVVANGPRQVEEALGAGCDAIEQGYGMGEENLRTMARKNVLWIPSILRAKNALDSAGSGGNVCCRFSQRYVAPGKAAPGAEAFWKKTLTDHLAQLRFARELGLPTAIGTAAGSAGILHGESMVEEMKLFLKAGYSLEEAIRCASKTGAEFFGMHNLGSLTVGQNATFLITRGSVKQLPRKLSYLEGIYADGIPSPLYNKNPVKSG